MKNIGREKMQSPFPEIIFNIFILTELCFQNPYEKSGYQETPSEYQCSKRQAVISGYRIKNSLSKVV